MVPASIQDSRDGSEAHAYINSWMNSRWIGGTFGDGPEAIQAAATGRIAGEPANSSGMNNFQRLSGSAGLFGGARKPGVRWLRAGTAGDTSLEHG